MKELTDLEICKRIAEIEGAEVEIGLKDRKGFQNLLWYDEGVIRGLYNPLTDNALCFRLMVKYSVIIDYERNGYLAVIKANKGYPSLGAGGTPNKAICLAIIEAHKGE